MSDLVNQILLMQSNIARLYQGTLAVCYSSVVDASCYDQSLQTVEALARRIREPVLHAMGAVQQLYIPPEAGSVVAGWAQAVDMKNNVVIDGAAIRRATLGQGGSFRATPVYVFHPAPGMSADAVQSRIAELSGKIGADIGKPEHVSASSPRRQEIPPKNSTPTQQP